MKERLIRLKVYFDRARMYASYAQLGMVFVVFLKAVKIDLPNWAYVPILLIGFFAAVFVGWLDWKLGLYEAENKRISELNPMLVEILEAVKRKNDDR